MNADSERHDQIKRWKQREKELVTLIRTCLTAEKPFPVNLSTPRHTAIAPALRRLAYDQRYRDRSFPVVYTDGSTPLPFPVGVLDRATKPTARELPKLILGLTSFRHTDMDFLVDLFLLTNRELDTKGTIADEERQACKAALDLFTDPTLRDGVLIYVLHTGLEPVVVGFYRAVIQALLYRKRMNFPRRFVVTPCIFMGDQHSGPYTAKSPGADMKNYAKGKSWW